MECEHASGFGNCRLRSYNCTKESDNIENNTEE